MGAGAVVGPTYLSHTHDLIKEFLRFQRKVQRCMQFKLDRIGSVIVITLMETLSTIDG